MPGLKTTLTLDNAQFEAALVRSRVMAALGGKDIQRNLAPDQDKWLASMRVAGAVQRGKEKLNILRIAEEAALAKNAVEGVGEAAAVAKGHVPGLNLVLRETLVIFREIGRGNWARVPGSFSLVLQGLRQMGYFIPALIGGAVLGGLGLLAWHLHSVAQRAKNLAELLDPLHRKFTDQADALRETSGVRQEYVDWLRKVGEHAESLPEKIDKLIRKMREEASAEEALAQAKGKTHQQILGMKREELEREIGMLSLAMKKAQEEKELADAEASAAAQEREHFDAGGAKGASTAAKNAGEIMDAIQAKFEKGGMVVSGQKLSGMVGGVPVYSQSSRPLGENDPLTVEVQGKKISLSLAEARDAYTKATALAAQYDADKKRLEDTLSSAKTSKEEKDKAVAKFAEESDDIKHQLSLLDKYGKPRAELEDAKNVGKNLIGSLNADQKVGAFSAVPSELAKIAQHTAKIEANTAHLKPEAHPQVAHVRTRFGGIHQ
jgi:hypothetical protein